MPTYQQLIDETQGWLNRRDIASLIPGWVAMVETEIAETLRARCMVVTVTQPIDNAYISLPADFATMESIRDANSGELLELNDEWSGHWTVSYQPGASWSAMNQVAPLAPCTGYRLVHDCIEWLPHPYIPSPPDPSWNPQQIMMGYYARPKPLLLPADTNSVLENLYGVYLFGVMKYGALFELDDDRAAQADTQWQATVTRANLWKQQSDMSGAPFRSILSTVF